MYVHTNTHNYRFNLIIVKTGGLVCVHLNKMYIEKSITMTALWCPAYIQSILAQVTQKYTHIYIIYNYISRNEIHSPYISMGRVSLYFSYKPQNRLIF